MKPANKELVGAATALLILGVLKRGSSYGYDIIRQVNAEAGGAFTWQEGTIYPLLHKLERQGSIRSRWQAADADAGGHQRKYYFLTPAGRAALQRGAEEWSVFQKMVLRLSGVSHA
jgi:DNA-binding PadR family transcriptional regulator